MFLKTLTMRGFKSFPDRTVLDLGPGISVVVGPNGSGKSNIVDALSWVLGTHSPRRLRAGAMADVIFAGSARRPALGRAVVEIVIDNSDGALPSEFSEVAVSRGMFTSGEHEYGMNGVPCRLLDVQELLSDAGLGRAHHGIVGQGQLEAVLSARPEDRRAFIEEAAGIAKHRKRRERALRKLDQVDDHLQRLQDVVRELRRGMRPLERQAEAAAKHAELQAALRRVRVVRALRALDELDRRDQEERAARGESDRRVADQRTRLDALRDQEGRLQAELDALAARAHEAGDTRFRLAGLVERLHGLGERIEERRHGLARAVEQDAAEPVPDPAELRARAAAEREGAAARAESLGHARTALEGARRERQAAEAARRRHQETRAAQARRRARAREDALRRETERVALVATLTQAEADRSRLATRVAELGERAARLAEEAAEAQRRLSERYGALQAAAGDAQAASTAAGRRGERLEDTRRAESDLERRHARASARAEALRAALSAPTAMAAVLEAAASGQLSGVVGPVADRVRPAEGMDAAAVAALEGLDDAVLVATVDDARDVVAFAGRAGAGRLRVLPCAQAEGDAPSADITGAIRALDALEVEPPARPAVARALAGVHVVDDLATARRLAQRHPDRTFVSRDGAVAGPRGWAGGPPAAANALRGRTRADEAEERAGGLAGELRAARLLRRQADQALGTARARRETALDTLRDREREVGTARERLERARSRAEAAADELTRLAAACDELDHEVTAHRERLDALASAPSRKASDGDGPADTDGPDEEGDRLERALDSAREAETTLRLEVGVGERTATDAAGRADALEGEAERVECAIAGRARRRARRLAAIERCARVREVADAALCRAESSLEMATRERDATEKRRAVRHQELGVLRADIREVEQAVADTTRARHAEELRRQQLAHAVEAARARLSDDLEVDPGAALADARAALRADGAGPLEGGAERDRALADDETRLSRKLGLLGTVNPLAVEEYRALRERNDFLGGQIDDLRSSRRDLREVVTAVDERIREVFAAAFADVAAQFERLFPRLFPGGRGRLVLTDPDDLLTTGVDIHARPPGTRVQRLSLLSGGERSLTALAVLFAIFAARPAPFYVLDEVEAALDDVNLQRFLEVVREFREHSQLLIVTHQQRTMEIADCLYGVSMRDDGVSTVISQRMADAAPA